MNQPSQPGKLNSTDYKHIAINGLIAIAAAIVAYALQVIPVLNFGKYQSIVPPILFILGYTSKRLVSGDAPAAPTK